MKKLIVFGCVALCACIISSCQKELSGEIIKPETYPSPFTGQLWIADTFFLTEPATYELLSESDKSIFGTIGNWWNGSNLLFKDNGDAQSDAGDWDFGYVSWRLVNQGKDIEVSLTSSKDTLYSWKMDDTTFSYQQQVSPTMNVTYVYSK